MVGFVTHSYRHLLIYNINITKLNRALNLLERAIYVKLLKLDKRHHQVLSIEIKGCKITETVMSVVKQVAQRAMGADE